MVVYQLFCPTPVPLQNRHSMISTHLLVLNEKAKRVPTQGRVLRKSFLLKATLNEKAKRVPTQGCVLRKSFLLKATLNKKAKKKMYDKKMF